LVSGGKRDGAGRRSRKLETGKISAYIQDREFLNQLANELEIPVVELLHQILIHKSFNKLFLKIQDSEDIKVWHRTNK